MSDLATARAKFERLISLIPRAARQGGVRLDELAELFEVPANLLVRDLQEVITRTDHHPAGSVDEFSVTLDQERISIWTTGEFRRPTRLSAREALALALGLRMLAAESGPERRRDLLDLAHRLDTALAATPAEEFTPYYGVEDRGDPTGIKAVLSEAARECRRCLIDYLKPGRATPERREISPYLLVHAEGTWYTLAHCALRRAVRAFRIDRICGVRPLPDRFEVPADFDPASYLSGGRLFRADQEHEAVVRYSPRIARWIAEREGVAPDPDGSITLRLRVADPQWLVRHVLQYGKEAEVLEPAEFRELVRLALAPNLLQRAGSR